MSEPRMLYGKELVDIISTMRPYKKTKPILAVQIHESIRLGEGFAGEITGELTVVAGSWLAHDPENNRTWPISESIFSKIYEPCDEQELS